MRLPVVAIVGRPNVGKSTLFNRLAGKRISIVEDLPGVTRDRIYAESTWDDMRVVLIDTGGFEPNPDTPLMTAVRDQTQIAIDEADLVLFLVDVRAGITPADREVADMLRRGGRPVVLAANKSDGPKQAHEAGEMYELGIPEVFPISAAHGVGVPTMVEQLCNCLPGELVEAGRAAEQARLDAEDALSDDKVDKALDDAIEREREREEQEADEAEAGEGDDEAAPAGPTPPGPGFRVDLPEVIRVAVVGKPNAGKSSFVNKLLGEYRHVVSELPGTTVDAVDSFLEHGGTRFRFIDTAGIRRKRSINLNMERYAVASALTGMDRCDVALFLIDAEQGLTEQDLKIAAFAEDKGKGIVICVNKWDLAKGNDDLEAKAFAQNLRDRMPFLSWAPIRFVSAKTGRKVFDVLNTVEDVADQSFSRWTTSRVNRVLDAAVKAHAPPVTKRSRRLKLYFATQVAVAPPTFVIATNEPTGVHFSYKRFLINRFREAFGFEGVPVRLIFRQRGDDAGREKNIEARKRRVTFERSMKKRRSLKKGH